MFYVAVPDVEAALRRAEELGRTRLLGPVTSPSGLVVCQFTDPEGSLIGVAGVVLTQRPPATVPMPGGSASG